VALRVGHRRDANPRQREELLDVSASDETRAQDTRPHPGRTRTGSAGLVVLGQVRAVPVAR
jgi:hypothetical protein